MVEKTDPFRKEKEQTGLKKDIRSNSFLSQSKGKNPMMNPRDMFNKQSSTRSVLSGLAHMKAHDTLSQVSETCSQISGISAIENNEVDQALLKEMQESIFEASEAKVVKNNMDRQIIRMNKKITKSHSINYDVIYDYLEEHKSLNLQDIKIEAKVDEDVKENRLESSS